MNTAPHRRRRPNAWLDSTRGLAPLKRRVAAFFLLLTLTQVALADDSAAQLRATLAELLRSGNTAGAVEQAQAALRAAPDDPAVRAEFVALHRALARRWLATGDLTAASAAVTAVLQLVPDDPAALTLRTAIAQARTRAAAATSEIEDLLARERYEAAFDRLQAAQRLQPADPSRLTPLLRRIQIGMADDHYLARNFPEAFALYEQLLTSDPNVPPSWRSRWALALALTLAESDFTKPLDDSTATPLLRRTLTVLGDGREPIVGQIIAGLLAERTGRVLKAGETYAAALGEVWQLPPTDRRAADVAALRARAIRQLRAIYESTPLERRDGFWAIALTDVWKERHTPHCVVYARNDVIAERVADAAERYLEELAPWLGIALPATWEPPCEIRVYETQAALHAATDTHGITYAVSHARVRGAEVLLRKLEVFQADPWLLGSTLPHELVHLLVAGACPARPLPLAVEEGIALQAEPPARRLMYRLRLPAETPTVAALLNAAALPADVESFYAQSATLVDWLLAGLDVAASSAEAQTPTIGRLRTLFCASATPNLRTALDFASDAAQTTDWQHAYGVARVPQRMPLVLLESSASNAATTTPTPPEGP